MPDSPNKFYGIAKNIAEIVLNHSWEGAKVVDVLLYGSTLTKSTPHDIDLLVLHADGADIGNYTSSRSQLSDNQAIPYWSSSEILNIMGHRGYEKWNEGAFARICSLLVSAGAIQSGDETFHQEQINKILDLHVLNTLLIREPSDSRELAIFLEGISSERRRAFPDLNNPRFNASIPQLREEAMRLSGKDVGFYHRVFTEGRLYDPSRKDFTTRFEDRYPGKLELFPKV